MCDLLARSVRLRTELATIRQAPKEAIPATASSKDAVSQLTELQTMDGNAVVGNEGVVGIALFMGGDTTPSRALVQSAGHGLRLEARALQHTSRKATSRRADSLQPRPHYDRRSARARGTQTCGDRARVSATVPISHAGNDPR